MAIYYHVLNITFSTKIPQTFSQILETGCFNIKMPIDILDLMHVNDFGQVKEPIDKPPLVGRYCAYDDQLIMIYCQFHVNVNHSFINVYIAE